MKKFIMMFAVASAMTFAFASCSAEVTEGGDDTEEAGDHDHADGEEHDHAH